MKSATDTRELGRSVRGPVLRPGEEGYELESAGYNLAILHQPDIVVGATDARDVVAAMKWAAQHEVPVAGDCRSSGGSSASPRTAS